MTWTLITSPIRLAAAAPASTAALTAATSPTTNAVTMPLPTLSQPASSTLAALSIASVASTSATNPFVSIMPSASSGAEAMSWPSPESVERFRVGGATIRSSEPDGMFPPQESACVTSAFASVTFVACGRSSAFASSVSM